MTVVGHVQANRFSQAFASLTPEMGPEAREFVDWIYFRDGGARSEPEKVFEFLEAHKSWPNTTTLRRRIEASILNGFGGRELSEKYFAKYEPITGDGMIALGVVSLRKEDADGARKWLSKAWREATLNATTEKQVLKLCSNCITAEDEKARMDAMIYDGSYGTAQRAAARLGKNSVRLVQARLSALKGLRKTASTIKGLPSGLQADLGLRHSHIRYLRRKDNHTEARRLLLGAPSDHDKLIAPGSWWTERRLLARHALGAGQFRDAYRIAAAHGYTEGNNFAEGEFLAGWIAFRHLKDYKVALRHFETLREGVTRDNSVTRAEYWLARTKRALGDAAAARVHFQTAAREAHNFYGQLAREELGGTLVMLDLPAEASPSADDRKRFNARAMVKIARLLGAAGATDLAGRFVSALSYDLQAPGEYAMLGKLAEGLSLPHVAVRVGKVAISREVPLNEVAYPLDNFPIPENASVETALLGGLARQESEFNWRAYSHAGARGLMQIMPATAKDISRNHNLPFSLSRLVEDPSYNVSMGEAYLGEMIDRFGGSYILAIAAYNAGPGRVGEWIKHYGDPRTGEIEPLDWIESIPFNETRAYVQHVLENLQIYRARLAGRPQPIELAADLARGKRAGKRASLN